MASQLTTLPFDCLYEIFENLENDVTTLHSCLLVNRLLCEISVRILWRVVGYSSVNVIYRPSAEIALSFFNALFACLPNESKEVLHNNENLISTPTLKSPFFNYATFCKVLSIPGINSVVYDSLKLLSIRSHVPLNDNYYYLVTNEFIKMFMKQASLKVLIYHNGYSFPPLENNFSFPCFPGMRNLSELHCKSSLPSDFFHQLSQNSHNIQSISISLDYNVSNELKELISSQNNLQSLTLKVYDYFWTDIIPALTKHSNTLTKLHFCNESEVDDIPLSFIGLFKNLQQVIFSFQSDNNFGPYSNVRDFEKLQDVNFPKLQTLKIPNQCPKPEYLMKFLETNGKHFNKVYMSEGILKPHLNNVRDLNNDLNLSIANFCPNLKRLIIRINDYEVDVLKTIFVNCQHLEFIKIECGDKFITETIFDIIINCAPKNFNELILYNSKFDYIHPRNLEKFFTNWRNRKQNQLLTLTMVLCDSFDDEYNDEVHNKEYVKEIVHDIINNYKHENTKNENDEDYENENINFENYEDCCNFIYYKNINIIDKYENLGIIKFRSDEGNMKEEVELDY